MGTGELAPQPLIYFQRYSEMCIRDSSSPGKACAKASHDHLHARLQQAIFRHLRVGDGNAGRGGVAVTVNVDINLAPVNPCLFSHIVDDADVGLVRDDPVNVGDGEAEMCIRDRKYTSRGYFPSS